MYRVRLDEFEGPLDLLLFFIRRDEIDVYDIPIAYIADEFLSYVQLMEQIDLDGVGDFLLMAATLIRIKASMLLPGQELDEEGEPIDPRKELVERLLEYVRFKEAADRLEGLQARREQHFTRGDAAMEAASISPEPPEVARGSLFDLIGALRRVLTIEPRDILHLVETEVFSVEEQMAFVENRLSSDGRIRFSTLAGGRGKSFIIATFLAILELARGGRVELSLTSDAYDFAVTAVKAAADAPGLNEDLVEETARVLSDDGADRTDTDGGNA